MRYVKIENGVVVQKQPYPGDGFIEVSDDVVCGMTYDGREFSVPVPPVRVPRVVSMRQAQLALLQAGLLPQIETAVAAAGPAAVIEWNTATEVDRDWPLVQQIAVGLGLTAEQIDQLYLTASTL